MCVWFLFVQEEFMPGDCNIILRTILNINIIEFVENYQAKCNYRLEIPLQNL